MGSKGSNFEREICKELSMWWTSGEREDIFWRSDSSGGRAKIRKQQGKSTYANFGDIKPIDPSGSYLTDVFSIEIKVGYKQWDLLDVLDHPLMRRGQKNRTYQQFEKFIFQIERDAEMANNYPALITKRDKRRKVITIPRKVFNALRDYCGNFEGTQIRIRNNEFQYDYTSMDFELFLNWVEPELFIDLDISLQGKITKEL